MTAHAILVVDTEFAISGSGGEDHAQGLVDIPVAEGDALNLTIQFKFRHVVEHNLGAETFGLSLHGHHQVRTLNAVGKSRVILDLGGFHKLAAGLD